MLFRKFEIFIAHRLLRGRNSVRSIRPVVRISIIAIALSSAVMIVTASVIRGFKSEITNKVIGFGAHILVSHYESQNSYETRPISRNGDIEGLEGTENIASVSSFVTKAGILKNGDLTQANVLKGVNTDYNLDFFRNYMIEGSIPNFITGKEILLSKYSASNLDLNVGDNVLLYFIQDPPRIRKLKVSGIYETGFAQFDELIGITDMKMLQQINGWEENQISGYEILIKDFNKLDETSDFIYRLIPPNMDAISIEERHPDIFNWLELQDINYIIIIGLMVLVAAINAISALLILILEKTSTIGILKAIGSNNTSIRRIFIYQGAYLLLTGLVWGNLVGIGIALIQKKYEIITLSVESYYLSSVPILMEFSDLLLINFGTIILCILALIIPSHLISRIQVVKVLKFD